MESKFSLKWKLVQYQAFCFHSHCGDFLFSEYEEDFEVDEEKQDEKANEEGQADDLMNGMSKSPSDDEKDHLDPEKESETLLRKAPDADDNVKDEGAGCSESELEEDKQGKLFSLSCDTGCLASVLTTFLFLIFNEIMFFQGTASSLVA